MGKTSKRAQQVSLTKVKPKGKELKSKLFAQVASLMEAYTTVFVFTYENFKTVALQKLRESVANSKFLMGKSKVLQAALVKSKSAEIEKLNKHMVGSCGLLFTNESPESIIELFITWRETASLLPGQLATETVVINKGIGQFDKFSNTIEPYLRKLGLATKLHDGTIEVMADFKVSKAGEPVTVEQSKILKLLDRHQGEMKIELKAVWQAGQYKALV